MSYEEKIAIRALGINASGWTDVVGASVLPIDCNTIVIFNNTGVDIYLRTDPGNASSQVTIGTGQQFELGSGHYWGGARFPRGCAAACSLMSSSGNVNAIVESIQ